MFAYRPSSTEFVVGFGSHSVVRRYLLSSLAFRQMVGEKTMLNLDDYQRGFGEESLGSIVLICCPNWDNFHEETLVQYVFFGRGIMVDFPSNQLLLKIRELLPEDDLVAIFMPCCICRSKGVSGCTFLFR